MRRYAPLAKNQHISFNPRICKRCDEPLPPAIFLHVGFNPRICKRCDPIAIPLTKTRKSFNPRICKRCDGYAVLNIAKEKVSIHASVKDATSCSYRLTDGRIVSIHASVKDATLPILMLGTVGGFNPRICKRCDFLTPDTPCFLVGFNPRICKRCDASIVRAYSILVVSIHASVKDATSFINKIVFIGKFQSTHL